MESVKSIIEALEKALGVTIEVTKDMYPQLLKEYVVYRQVGSVQALLWTVFTVGVIVAIILGMWFMFTDSEAYSWESEPSRDVFMRAVVEKARLHVRIPRLLLGCLVGLVLLDFIQLWLAPNISLAYDILNNLGGV